MCCGIDPFLFESGWAEGKNPNMIAVLRVFQIFISAVIALRVSQCNANTRQC